MPDTVLSLGLAVAFVLPGFVIIDLAESRRATRPARSDLELVLRGLAYALILQGAVALTGWTGTVIDQVEDGWQDHLGELVVFGLVVGLAIPACLGLALSEWLRRAEQKGELRAWHYALGGRETREAWDHVFSREKGTYLLVTVFEGEGVRHLLAKYGLDSWASQTPTRPQELYLEEVWPADSEGVVSPHIFERQPPRGMWVSAEKIDPMHL